MICGGHLFGLLQQVIYYHLPHLKTALGSRSSQHQACRFVVAHHPPVYLETRTVDVGLVSK